MNLLSALEPILRLRIRIHQSFSLWLRQILCFTGVSQYFSRKPILCLWTYLPLESQSFDHGSGFAYPLACGFVKYFDLPLWANTLLVSQYFAYEPTFSFRANPSLMDQDSPILQLVTLSNTLLYRCEPILCS